MAYDRMTKSQLKTGMQVVLKNGKTMLVFRTGSGSKYLSYQFGAVWMSNYEDDLTHKCDEEMDIVKVYSPADCASSLSSLYSQGMNRNLIFERRGPKRMTKEELEKLLGYEIEIINNDISEDCSLF